MANSGKAPGAVDAVLDPASFEAPSGYKPGGGHHDHPHSFTSTRTTHHRGHKIKVRTTYRIEIDDTPLTVHTMVMDDGTVHCHGLPNYAFKSALEMAKSIVDAERLIRYAHDDLGSDPDADDTHGGHH
ncbi:hypothetical protein [Tateyamaria sp. SN6-1]|uniref:hypothetical protein n=1 Tax=Tateyamaria sp. SN6-1 TaxID=3092148 RepID=UPI0039F5A3BA